MEDFFAEGRTLILKNREEVVLQRQKVDRPVGYHKHDYIEIAYVDSGQGFHQTEDGVAVPIAKGDLVLLNPQLAHRYALSETAKTPLIVYNCMFDPAVLNESITKEDDFINIVYRFLFETSRRDDPEERNYIMLRKSLSVEHIIKEMYAEHTAKVSGYVRMNKANLIRLLIAVFRLWKQSEEISYTDAYQKAVAESAIRYMQEYYAENIRCEFLASRAYLSEGYFYKLFKRVTGVTPIRFLQNIRLEKAAELLCGTSLSVQKIALSVGYSDMKYFYRIFGEKYHETPRQYRESVFRGSGKSGAKETPSP